MHAHTHTHTQTHTHLHTLGTPVTTVVSDSNPRQASHPTTMVSASPVTNANLQMISRQQLTPLTSIVEAVGLSQVVANLTSGLFSSTQLPPNLVTTLTQAGSGIQTSASTGSAVSCTSAESGHSLRSADVNSVNVVSNDIVTNGTMSTQVLQDISQVQSTQE